MQNIRGASVATLSLALTMQLGFTQMPALNLPQAAIAGLSPAQSLFASDDTIQQILDERAIEKRAFGIALATRGLKGNLHNDHAASSGQDGEKEKSPSPRAAEPLRTDEKPAVVVARLEKRVPELMKEADVPGLAIALLRDGELVWQRGFGVKNSKTKEPVDDAAVFEAASLGKPLFAYGVLKLVDAGKFDLDKPLDEYLPSSSADKNGSKVTARHVLSHTAGFWHGGGFGLKTHFTPGERFSYSGFGYEYLTRVIEHVTGEKFNDFMKRVVFDPLEMTSTSSVWLEAFDKSKVSNHNTGGEPTGQHKPPPERASEGSVFRVSTTARDYSHYVAAMLNGTGLKPQTRTLMLTPQIKVCEGGPVSIDHPQANTLPDVSWGIGWGLQTTPDGQSFWHWGDAGDGQAFIVAFPKPKLAVVFFANSANGLSIAREIVAEAVGGTQPGLDWLNYDRFNSPKPLLFKQIRARGAVAALRAFRTERVGRQPGDVLNEDQMNGLGYNLLEIKRIDDAIEVFKQNVADHPASANAYDSLAEGFEAAGDKTSAIKNFKKSLELNPKNIQRIEHLKKLEADVTKKGAS